MPAKVKKFGGTIVIDESTGKTWGRPHRSHRSKGGMHEREGKGRESSWLRRKRESSGRNPVETEEASGFRHFNRITRGYRV